MASTGRASVLRQRRLDSGLTQSELARRAGVSRQLIAAVEAGQNAPAVDAALALARALGTSVEDLFAAPPANLVPALGGALRERVPLRIGRVAERLVAWELPEHGVAGPVWAEPDGMLDGGTLRLFPGAAPDGLVLAGCDPALGVADAMLRRLGPRSVRVISASTGRALRALECGGVHGAVVHGPPGGLPVPPVPVVRMHFARWQVGLGVAPAVQPRSLEAIARGDVMIVQRDPEAASQQAFRRASAAAGLEALPPGPRVATHFDAARLAGTVSGAAVTTEAAAKAFNLDFLPFEEHTVEVWLADGWRDHPGAHAFADLLNGSSFTERIRHIAAYDLAGCGSAVAPGGG
jgi:transcriptional regulator with XRE-family HTH domain